MALCRYARYWISGNGRQPLWAMPCASPEDRGLVEDRVEHTAACRRSRSRPAWSRGRRRPSWRRLLRTASELGVGREQVRQCLRDAVREVAAAACRSSGRRPPKTSRRRSAIGRRASEHCSLRVGLGAVGETISSHLRSAVCDRSVRFLGGSDASAADPVALVEVERLRSAFARRSSRSDSSRSANASSGSLRLRSPRCCSGLHVGWSSRRPSRRDPSGVRS